MNHPDNSLRAERLFLDSGGEAIAIVREDCAPCRSEGFSAHARINLTGPNGTCIATLYQTASDLLPVGSIGLSEAAWLRLALTQQSELVLSHPAPLTSAGLVRAKIFGQRLSEHDMLAIIKDVVAGNCSDLQLTAFLTACASRPLDLKETIALTRAMVDTGTTLNWDRAPIADKHCVGGLPANRTTPIIVAIAAACGLTIPKTSSRAITSPSGTADTMSVLTRVDLGMTEMQRVVREQNGCFVLGGAVSLSPSDDSLVRIERALDLDAPGQLVASVLSKKIAAGATHILIDIPVGATAKIRNRKDADALIHLLEGVAKAFDLRLAIEITDGHQPIGRGVGPALEARDVLAVLNNADDAPSDLAERACYLAGRLLELTGAVASGSGDAKARDTLLSGAALKAFESICRAQGDLKTPPQPTHKRPIYSPRTGKVATIDNRRLAKAAKLAGAPDDPAAGLDLHVRLGDRIEAGAPLFTLHTESAGELAYAVDYVMANTDIIELTRP